MLQNTIVSKTGRHKLSIVYLTLNKSKTIYTRDFDDSFLFLKIELWLLDPDAVLSNKKWYKSGEHRA